MDTRRHAPLGRVRSRFVLQPPRRRGHAYLGPDRRPLAGIFASDHADTRQGGRFRWLLSTCLAGMVGVLAILVVIAGAGDDGGVLWRPLPRWPLPATRVAGGLRWELPKVDKIPNGAMATRFVIRDLVQERRGKRDYITHRHYVRLVARLAPITAAEIRDVPRFLPYKLYADTAPLDGSERPGGQPNAVIKLVELWGAMLPPNEDGQEFDAQEVAALVLRAQTTSEEDPPIIRAGFGPEGGDRSSSGQLLAERSQRSAIDVPAPNTTFLQKSVFDSDDPAEDTEERVMRRHKVQRGDSLPRILVRLGAEPAQARLMNDAARGIFPESALMLGHEVRVTLVPSALRANRFEPARFSVFDEAGNHKVTVARNAAGEFAASGVQVEERVAHAAVAVADEEQPQPYSLYASMHHTAAKQGVPADMIMQIMRIHAYDTDFRQRVRAGDSFEFFFDLKDEDKTPDGNLGTLLATSISSGGETHRFYRFQTVDGAVDYFDEHGNTSRKFLMRRPVRGEDVRLTSGFGPRRHPILKIERMHSGEDWACAPGTQIMAAGNGIIEEAGRKGEYGNYIRIRHANGYKTAYGHMLRFAPGVAEGVRVRQGQFIGEVGATGMASGPHVHFEVIASNKHVDPMTIQVPRERKLSGKELADFKQERARIEGLMKRNPSSTKVAATAQERL